MKVKGADSLVRPVCDGPDFELRLSEESYIAFAQSHHFIGMQYGAYLRGRSGKAGKTLPALDSRVRS